MTDDLAFDLRGFARELFHGRQVDQYATDRILEAADCIEALKAKVEGLRDLLVRGYVVCDGDDEDAVAFRNDVRAALGEKQ